jgi:tRNA/tmRNA/rRNA uracil-C5-methylase (TrmA/RlmC/RlmD family)
LWHDLQPHLDLLPPRATRLTLRLDRMGTRHVIAESPGEPWRTADRLRAVLAGGGELVCWWHPTGGAPRVIAGTATGFPPIAFEPVNPAMAEIARRWGLAQLGTVRDRGVWDLYGGAGDTTRLLAERGARVTSVDADEKAIGWARRRDDLAPFAGQVRFLAARAEDVIAGLPEPEIVVVSPPRAGLHWDVTLRLTGAPVPQLLYWSSDPATLARDLRRLSVNYLVRAVRAFDLQPQTAHVDTVVHLVKA